MTDATSNSWHRNVDRVVDAGRSAGVDVAPV
jgi:hypothetical protein